MTAIEERQRHIDELERYIREHPAPSTAMGRQAKADRERALKFWLNQERLAKGGA